MHKKNAFVISVGLFTLLLVVSIFFMSKFAGWLQPSVQLIIGDLLVGVFVIYFGILYYTDLYIPNVQSFKEWPYGLLLFSITALLVLSILDKQVGIYATAFFVLCSVIYAIAHRKIYALHPIYLLVFSYPLLEFIGTIGTPGGFRFPDMTLTFYLVPFAFCCFKINKVVLHQIIRLVVRLVMVFMMLSVVNWYFNLLQTDVTIKNWISNKVIVNGAPAYQYVCSWCYYKHPSYINLVLLSTLISGFYVFYQKESKAVISAVEIIIFVAFCIFMQLIMESRIGLVGLMFILITSGLYYLYVKKLYFKTVLITFLIVGAVGFVTMRNSVSNFVADPVRTTYSAWAMHYIEGHVWWGAGYNQEATVLLQQEKELMGLYPPMYQPKTYTHNQLLGTMIQFGVPGAIVLLSLMFGLLWFAIRYRSYMLQLFICLYILFMFIEEPLYVQEGITRFMVFLSMFIHFIESENDTKIYPLFNRFSKR